MANIKNTEKRYPITINVLRQLRFEASNAGKTANWILTVGKAGVLFTFSVLALALFYRFTLDRQVEAQRHTIKENLDIIQSYDQVEAKIRSSQKKLEFIEDLTKTNQSSVLFFQKIESSLPKDIYLETFQIDYQGQSIQIKGKATDEVIFSQLINALQSQEEFTEISVNQIQSKGTLDPEISFTMNVILAKL